MKATFSTDPDHLSLFFTFTAERHRIYRKRKAGSAPPWTDDPILQTYKFTNIFRDLDPGTLYVTNKILPKLTSAEDVIFNLIIYRLFNRIATFDAVGIQSVTSFDRAAFESRLRELARTQPVFTNAHIVSGYAFIPGKDKIEKVCTILEGIHRNIPRMAKDVLVHQDSDFTFNTLHGIKGLGNFLAYQICVDIGYWNSKLYNESEHVVCGPGCLRGLSRIFRGKYDPVEAIRYLESVQYEQFRRLNIDSADLFEGRRLNLMAIEGCLCEFFKYDKALRHEGRPRNRYVPSNLL
ncbi:MAG: nucleotide kinase domain-containing protein [bacterium]